MRTFEPLDLIDGRVIDVHVPLKVRVDLRLVRTLRTFEPLGLVDFRVHADHVLLQVAPVFGFEQAGFALLPGDHLRGRVHVVLVQAEVALAFASVGTLITFVPLFDARFFAPFQVFQQDELGEGGELTFFAFVLFVGYEGAVVIVARNFHYLLPILLVLG
jgi:hypothetical protein